MGLHVSVVIIGRNEGSRLVRCLDSVAAARLAGDAEVIAEVIYVDSESTDGSGEAAGARGAKVFVLKSERPSAARGRNLGWRAAQGEFILFLDGDTILDADFVDAALPEFHDPSRAVVWGHRREIEPRASVYNRVLDLDWIAPAGPCDFCGGDALIRRSALEQVGGYDETLIAGEEPEMCRRMRACGHTIMHVDRPMTGHDLAITRWNQYWRRAVRTGHAYREVSERFRATAMPLWEPEARRNLTRASLLMAIPLLALATALLFRSAWPLFAALAVLMALALRSARRFSWKASDPLTALLYGIHSHVQQIPIFFGQISYWRARRSGRRRKLIEYKGTAA